MASVTTPRVWCILTKSHNYMGAPLAIRVKLTGKNRCPLNMKNSTTD